MARKWPIVIVALLAVFFLAGAVYPKGRYIITTPESLGAPVGGQRVECWLGEDKSLTCFDIFGEYTIQSGEQIVARGSPEPFD